MKFNPWNNAILVATGCALAYAILAIGICLLI